MTGSRPQRVRGNSALLWILLAVVVVSYAFPFIYLALTSFKTPVDAIAVPLASPLQFAYEAASNTTRLTTVSRTGRRAIEGVL